MSTSETNLAQDDVEEANAMQRPAPSTLLPTPIANVVSLVTRSSSLYLRLGTFIGGLALDGARVTTLTGLELSRAVIEGILHRAGRDVATRSTGELGQAEAEGLLERSIGTLHSTITSISFAASTGFHLSSTVLSSASDLSQQLLVTLDSILGSTDSSRAIASIITLIRREFQNPATGKEGEKVSVADLLVGICGLALLQRWCKKITDDECRNEKYEEVVWDVVILDDGRRADVVSNETTEKALTRANSISFMTTDGHELVQTIQREGRVDDDSDDDLPEINLKQKIMRSLPTDASVSITTETTTTKTITVEITGTQPPDLSPPPGVEIVETSRHAADTGDGERLTNEQKIALLIPRYRVVYRIIRNRLRGTDIESKTIEPPEEAIVSDDENDPAPKESVRSPGFIVSPISSPDSEKPPPLPEKDVRVASSSSIDMSASMPDSGDEKLSSLPRPKSTEIIANQKRSRKPMSASSSISGDFPPAKKTATKSPPSKKPKPERPSAKHTEKKGTFRNALRKGSEKTLSNLWNKDNSDEPKERPKPAQQKPQWGVGNLPPTAPKSQLPVPQRNSSMVPARDAPRPPQRGNPNYFSSRDLGLMQGDLQRSPSRASYYSVHERRRDSLVSQTDTYSIHSAETRPGSPTAFRTHLRTQSNLLRARSEKTIAKQQPGSPVKNHRRSRSHVPSIYTLKTNASNASLVLADQPRKSAFQDSETLEHLMRTGFVAGLFPQNHIVRNITRFVRFASASYGASFLRIMGITSSNTPTSREIDTFHHHEHHSFSTHTQLPADTILLSSFVDPQGGTDSSGNTNTGVPMVHFVSLDHESKAVVLTCRGTLGFEDILTDLTCDYDELSYRGKAYKVHKGIHASARRLLDGGGGRVMATIAAALEEFPDYGLVLCGHSLGGAVTALLATLIAEPSSDPTSSAFFTSSEPASPQLLLTSSEQEKGTAQWRVHLPPGRPIHVYAYGPPSTMSPSLRLATRGLITTIVNGQDLVPYLSLGVLHDLQAIALAFKTDDSGAKGEVRKRVWAGITGTFADKWYSNRAPVLEDEDDQWAYSALKTLRASMLSAKLLPPGEVFAVEAMPVLQRDAFIRKDNEARGLGRPATRTVLKYVRNVEKRFSEVTFGGSMLLDHSPGRYEASLAALRKGVLG
ncbi:related to lipase [Phialocephala subalpina]|uniref:sn-1-specific diacylglycerol lipase n=1 Tax=Phialocephala subalpina TaxID=576137 RepID=A0A1L7WF88_9HELO|nr:related to lipase [Phialocephala subalpina]